MGAQENEETGIPLHHPFLFDICKKTPVFLTLFCPVIDFGGHVVLKCKIYLTCLYAAPLIYFSDVLLLTQWAVKICIYVCILTAVFIIALCPGCCYFVHRILHFVLPLTSSSFPKPVGGEDTTPTR